MHVPLHIYVLDIHKLNMQKCVSSLRAWIGHRNCYLCTQRSKLIVCQSCEQDVLIEDCEGIFLCHATVHKVSANLLNKPDIVDQLLPPAYSALYALSDYQWPINRIISDLKFAGKSYCAQLLIDWVGKRFNNYIFADVDAFVPIPLSTFRYIHRQYNQAQLLSKALATRTGTPSIDLLRRRKQTKAQATLGKDARIENVSSAFACAPLIYNIPTLKHIILVDDVLTTGATLNEACRTLLDIWPDLQISVMVMAIALPGVKQPAST